MLVYSTQFQVKESLDIESFISLVRTWLCNAASKSRFDNLTWNWEEESSFVSIDGKSTLSIYVLLEKNTVAIKLSSLDNRGIVWDNYYSLVGNEMYTELQKHNQDTTGYLADTYHLPRLINLLYENDYIYFEPQGELISGKMTLISAGKDSSLQLAKNIISYNTIFDKPIVYITHADNCEYKYPYVVNIETLNKQLLGLAYVVVEDSVNVAKYICELTDFENPYKGAIQIYYPNGYTKRIIPCLDADIPEYKLRNEIVSAILNRYNSKIDKKFTLSYIASEIYKIQINNLQKEKNNAERLQEELDLRNKRILELETENKQFKSDIYSYQSKCANLQNKIDCNVDANMLLRGELEDLYDNEIFDCIYDILLEVSKTTNEETRQYEILKQILDVNKHLYQNSRQSKIEEFKQLSYNANGATKRFIADLNNMGLEVYGKKHPKIKFPNGKQLVTLSSTPSNSRDADNATSEFKKLF